METAQEKQDEIFRLYKDEGLEIKAISHQVKVPLRTVYRILKKKNVVFRGVGTDEKIYVKEDKIAELLKVKLLDIKKEFPDFNIDLAIDRVFSKRGIGSEKVIKCIKDPVKLDRKLVEIARSRVFFILNSMKPEDIEKATLNVKTQALPILLDIACNQYPLQPEGLAKPDPKQLKQNILVLINGIAKSDPLLTKEIKDILAGIKKATEENRLPKLKELEERERK